MVKLIKIKLNGSTLVEVLISMIIILVVFSIALKIYANVTAATLSSSVQKINIISRSLLKNAILRKNLKEEEILRNGITYKITVIDYRDQPDLKKIEIKAYLEDKLVVNAAEVVSIDENETP